MNLNRLRGTGLAFLLALFAVISMTAQASTLPLLAVTDIAPSKGPAGTVIHVHGTGLKSVERASVGGVSAKVLLSTSSGLVYLVVPTNTAGGTVTVSNAAATATSPQSFQMTPTLKPYSLPVLTGFSPTSGAPGIAVSVSGSGFSGATLAQIGASAATPVTVISDTSLIFTVPARAVSGTVSIINGNRTGVSTQTFTVTTAATPPPNIPVNDHITVDQFGYRPTATKTAVIRNPSVGFDNNRSFTPGSTYRVIRSSDGAAVLSGTPKPWNNGTLDASSGDFGWWFDFSSVTAPGKYYVLDVDRGVRSPEFRIDAAVYRDALKAATRMFFYQRSGFAKQQPYAEACWCDAAAFVGPNQDGQAHDVTDRTNNAKVRDLSGGWFDAGDANKYVTFAFTPVHQLLSAYEETPAPFTDNFNIPESGNGIPDVIDEVKWEIDWLKKMQNSDGSALLKVGGLDYTEINPPSADPAPKYYVPACTSATAAVAGMFAHASTVFQRFPALQSDAADLKTRAINAYNRYLATPTKQTSCDDGSVKAGNADLAVPDQENLITLAAVYLYGLTGDTKYNDRVKANYRSLRPYNDMGWSRYSPEQGVALLYYTQLPNADTTLKNAILADKLSDVRNSSQIYGLDANADLYRNLLNTEQYHWGSNQVRANYGNTNRDVATYHIAVSDTAPYQTRAEDTLHWFHGVNPFGMVFMTNVNKLGPTRSVSTIFHRWFRDGDPKWDDVRTSSCGPAPGYIPGGPNRDPGGSGVPSYLSPPLNQPPEKSYLEWNNPNEASYAITEPGIYYQSAYVKLVAGFAQ